MHTRDPRRADPAYGSKYFEIFLAIIWLHSTVNCKTHGSAAYIKTNLLNSEFNITNNRDVDTSSVETIHVRPPNTIVVI